MGTAPARVLLEQFTITVCRLCFLLELAAQIDVTCTHVPVYEPEYHLELFTALCPDRGVHWSRRDERASEHGGRDHSMRGSAADRAAVRTDVRSRSPPPRASHRHCVSPVLPLGTCGPEKVASMHMPVLTINSFNHDEIERLLARLSALDTVERPPQLV